MHDAAGLARIQHAARYGRVLFTSHAEDRMVERRVRVKDIQNALRTATACEPQTGDKGPSFRVEGRDCDGTVLALAVAEIQPGLLIITLF